MLREAQQQHHLWSNKTLMYMRHLERQNALPGGKSGPDLEQVKLVHGIVFIELRSSLTGTCAFLCHDLDQMA